MASFGIGTLAGDRLVLLVIPEEIVAGDLFLRDFRQFEHEIYHLVLEDRRTQGGYRLGSLAVIVPYLLLVPRHLARPIDDCTLDLLVGHRDIILLSDFGEDEAKPNAPVCDGAILIARLVFGRALVGERAALRLEIALHRAPDVLELLLGERRRQPELVHLVELVEKLALDPLTARAGVLLLEARLDRVLELIERIEAKSFRELVIDCDRAWRLDRFRRDIELGFLAGKLGFGITGGKCDPHQALFACGHADELILEPRDERSGPDIHSYVAAGAAFERLAVDAAGKIDDDAISRLNLCPLRLDGIRLVLFRKIGECFTDLRLGDFRRQALDCDTLEIGEVDLWQKLERQRIGEIGPAADELLDFGLFVRKS